MTFETQGTLSTRVGRRLFAIFLAFALVPLLLFSASAWRQVTGELRSQAEQRLGQLAKTEGMGIMERLQLVSTLVRTRADLVASAEMPAMREALVTTLPPGLISLRVLPAGELPDRYLQAPTRRQQDHLGVGRPVLLTGPGPSFWTGVVVSRATGEVLWGRIDPDFLWATRNGTAVLPPGTELCVLGADRTELNCTAPIPLPTAAVSDTGLTTAVQTYRASADEEEYLAAGWPLFLGYEFATESWDVVVAESWGHVVAPIRQFQNSFILIVLLVASLISGLSARLIRWQMTPLAHLHAGTRILARGDFDHRVQALSTDEFGQLATAFNQMAADLGRHVRTLEAAHTIDRAVLSTRDRREIVELALGQAPTILPGDGFGLALAHNDRDRWTWEVATLAGDTVDTELVVVPESERAELEKRAEGFAVDGDRPTRSYLAGPVLNHERRSAFVFPVVHGGWVQGAVLLAFRSEAPLADAERHRARQLADRIAVAVSNARLLEDLHEMHEGTLTTLARAIDAKSPWTAGHSERVTELAVTLGRRMGLEDDQLVRLYRGGLLHDVGKIGIPAEILDKPFALTDAEREVMESHTTIGSRILAPIPAYHDLTEIVRHHHERWDGMGYPDRLQGDAIPFLARVMAVADVYDALTSARPYRPGWEHTYALAAIRRGSGSAFDPLIVQEFLALMAPGWTPRVPRAADPGRHNPALATAGIDEDLLRG